MPSLGILTVNALAAADKVIIPVQSHFLAARGMTNLIRTFNVPLTFGSSLNGNGNPQRYFNGALKNMRVIIYE